MYLEAPYVSTQRGGGISLCQLIYSLSFHLELVFQLYNIYIYILLTIYAYFAQIPMLFNKHRMKIQQISGAKCGT